LLEVNLYDSQTCIGGAGRDIHHVFHPVDALFQRHDDAVHHSFGIGARIAGGYIDCGRSDVGILLHRQGEE